MKNARPRPISAIRQALTLLVQHPELASQIGGSDAEWEDFQAAGLPLLRELLDLLHIEPNLTTAALIERWRGTETAAILVKLAAGGLSIPDDGLLAELRGALEQISGEAKKGRIDRILERAKTTPLSEDERVRLRALLAERAAPKKEL